jgi:hypothetical protein
MTESIGVRWIGKAKSDVELPIGVAASTTSVLDTALSVESKALVGLGSEASGREERFHYVRVIPLIHPCGDFALALGHGWRPGRWRALVWLVFTSLTDFLTPTFSDAAPWIAPGLRTHTGPRYLKSRTPPWGCGALPARSLLEIDP